MGKKVIVIPCSGIGKPLGSVGRQATYEVVENLRHSVTATTCLALLVSGDGKALDLVRSNHCIALDGCPKECARKNIELAGGTVESQLRAMDVYKEHRDLKPEAVLHLGESGEKLVHELALRVAAEVDALLGMEGS
jgi:uncharacterized metal-binding protein